MPVNSVFDFDSSPFRCAHSIKGASGTFSLDAVARFTHSLENLLDRMRDGTLEATSDLLDLLLRSSDVLRNLLKCASPSPAGVEEVLSELNEILGHDSKSFAPRANVHLPTATLEIRGYRVVFVPDRDLLRQGMDPLLLLRDLSQVGDITDVAIDLSRLPQLCELDPEECYLGWSIRLTSRQTTEQIADVFMFVRDSSRVDVEVLKTTPGSAADHQSRQGSLIDSSTVSQDTSTRIPLANATDLLRLATELVRAQTSIAQAASDFALSIGTATSAG